MRVLMVLNYQREIPPFMLTELKFASEFYDRVIYITRELVNDNSHLLDGSKISVMQMTKRCRVSALLRLPGMIFRKEVRQEANHARCDGLPGKIYWKHLLCELYSSQALYHCAEPILHRLYKRADITLMSVWFAETAYTAARLKRKYPEITAASLAHSFEIDPEKSSVVSYSLNQYKHLYLDLVTFISKRMKEIYFETLKKWVKPNQENCDVQYLGCVKDYPDRPSMTECSTCFVICSCSGLVAVKRVNLIIQALEDWCTSRICWIHLGGGVLEQEIQAMAKEKLDRNPWVSYRFEGQLQNRDVQKYYSEHKIDLFLNVSAAEGLPVSIMEAMAYGIPVMATDVGGTAEIVTNETGILLSKNIKPEELRQAIENYINLEQTLKQQYQTKAQLLWKEKFNAAWNIPKYFESLKMAAQG